MPKRDYALRPKFFIWDGFLAIPLLFMMVYPRWSTLAVVFGFGTFLFLLERRGMKVPMRGRWCRAFLTGPERYIRPWWRRH
jgi:hypothetical protein